VLDIGFIWIVYLDGQMGLLPVSLAMAELEVAEASRTEISAELDQLFAGEPSTAFKWVIPIPVECRLDEVSLYDRDEERRIALLGEGASLAIETSIATAKIAVIINHC
jgi:hypothetical protein